ncbi:WD40 repeat-like protein [Xylariaceae sp. FL0016]|nr:WD40 repeat-like protein [Xylariaceae sp. FL0016]
MSNRTSEAVDTDGLQLVGNPCLLHSQRVTRTKISVAATLSAALSCPAFQVSPSAPAKPSVPYRLPEEVPTSPSTNPQFHAFEVADQHPHIPSSTTPSTSDDLLAPQSPHSPPSTALSAPVPAASSYLDRSSFVADTSLHPQQPPVTTSVQRQILGRRRRLSGDDPGYDQRVALEATFAETSVPAESPQSPRKKRRREATMLADTDGSLAANGTPRPLANGKTSNGMHKPVVSINGSSSKSKRPEKYWGHDREEVTRILIQALSDMGYHSAARSVSHDSGYELESPTVASFRNAVLEGEWDGAERLLFGATTSGDPESQSGNGLVLASGADRSVMRFWIRQQKFLELLEERNTSRALIVLRTELTPLYHDTQKLHFLSGLIMCQSPEDLRSKADWDGAHGQSRHKLLSELSKCISPSVMLPEHRLARLLHQVKESQIGGCLWHCTATSPSLYYDHFCDRRQFPTETVLELDDHAGEVWQVAFSHDGTKLATCGGDHKVIIWDVPSFKVIHTLKDHEGGVGNVAWSWDDSMIVSCCQDRYARLWDAATGTCLKRLQGFAEPVSSCVWAADNQSFITGSLDKDTSLVQWDLDGNKIYDWASVHRVEELAVSPDGHWLVAMDHENQIHVYNFVTRDFEYKMDLRCRLTSVSISHDSRYLLVNQNNGIAQLIDLILREPVQKYTGHKGGDYMLRSSLGGADESFVICGSEDGQIHIWHKPTAQPVERLVGHSTRCNSVAWCPTNPRLFASCGDDGKVKIWSNEASRSSIRS